MDNNHTEIRFIENCFAMSFDELSIFVKNCLEKLDKQSDLDIDLPRHEDTFNELISLLEKKAKDDLKTPKIRKYLQDYREKNSYYSKQNNKYEEFTKSSETFLKRIEQIKGKFKTLESTEISDLDILVSKIKSQNSFIFNENDRTEIRKLVTAKIISDDMFSYIMELMSLLRQNKEFSVFMQGLGHNFSTDEYKFFDSLTTPKIRLFRRESWNLMHILESVINLSC